MDIYQTITTRRTIRFFDPKPIDVKLLEQIVDAGRVAPSAGNRQILEYIAIQKPENCQKMLDQLKWAAYIQPKRTPTGSQAPTAYVIVLIHDQETTWINAADAGAAMENMILTAWSHGIGSCWLASVDRENVKKIFAVPDEYQIFGVLALGYPSENPTAVEMKDSIKYWLDENNRLNVPKRKLSNILHHEKF
jgi:nitroreductase